MNTTPVTCPICGEEIHSGNCTHSRQDFIREIERLRAAIAEAIVLNNVLHGMYKVTQLLGNALEKREAANE